MHRLWYLPLDGSSNLSNWFFFSSPTPVFRFLVPLFYWININQDGFTCSIQSNVSMNFTHASQRNEIDISNVEDFDSKVLC